MPSSWNIDIAGQLGQPGGPPGAPGSVGPTGPVGPGYQATSTTNLPLALGPITIATQAGLAYTVGARVRLASNSAPGQWMEGPVTAYSGTSLSLNIDLLSTGIMVAQYVTLPNYLGGLTLSNDATSPNTVLDIATGCATSDDNTTTMPLVAANFTKNCNAAWAVGSGNGALDTGSALVANAWYHVFLITRTDTGVVDVLISTSVSAPTLPTNYTKRRRIGTIATNASAQIIAFTQFGDQFLWTTVINNYSNVGVSQTQSQLTLSVPPGIKVIAIFGAWFYPNVNSTVLFQSPDVTSGLAVGSNTNISIWGTAAGPLVGFECQVRTNTSQQINMVALSTTTNGLYINTRGWIDHRGK
jgi:hypothetical protein